MLEGQGRWSAGEQAAGGLPDPAADAVTIVDVEWSLTRVRYLWCLRHEISSTPMSTRPSTRWGSMTSAATRSHMAPTVRQATRANVATVVLSERVTNHTTRSSKSAGNRAPGQANGTASVTTPCSGRRRRADPTAGGVALAAGRQRSHRRRCERRSGGRRGPPSPPGSPVLRQAVEMARERRWTGQVSSEAWAVINAAACRRE